MQQNPEKMEDKQKLVEKRIRELLKRYNLQIGYGFSFPRYKILPDEVKLALVILQTHGLKIIFSLKPQTSPRTKSF